MSGWHSQCGIIGGFMWLYDDFVGTGEAKQYASAINTAVGQPGFTLSGPSTVYLNQNSSAPESITITDQNGFTGTVTLTLSALPQGVKATIQGAGTNKQKIVFKATANATTGSAAVTVTGTSGTITQTLNLTLSVSSGVGTTGKGTPVDLSAEETLYGIYTDGSTYTTGGLDGQGYSYSANLLTPSRAYNGVLLDFGPSNAMDTVSANGQTIALPTGQYSVLMMLGTAVNGNQTAQTITVTYTDGSSTQFKQSFSDWFTPQKYTGESAGVIMAYRNSANGTKDKRVFNLYEYRFALNKSKTVESVTLPNNSHVAVLAATVE